MADLVTTITETVTLNGSLRGSSNTLTTANIVDVFERILTCTHSQTTTVAVFGSTPPDDRSPKGAEPKLQAESLKSDCDQFSGASE